MTNDNSVRSSIAILIVLWVRVRKIVSIEIEMPIPTESRKLGVSRRSASWIMQNVAARETSNVTEMKGKGAGWWKKRSSDEGQRVSDAVVRSKNTLKRVWSPRSSREWRNQKRSAEARDLRARGRRYLLLPATDLVLFMPDYWEQRFKKIDCDWMFYQVIGSHNNKSMIFLVIRSLILDYTTMDHLDPKILNDDCIIILYD